MRIGLVAVFAAMTSSAQAGYWDIKPCDLVPPLSAQQPVTVEVEIADAPDDQMWTLCHPKGPEKPAALTMWGCSFAPGNVSNGYGILLNASLTPDERACVLTYEKAHLPPNNWYDPKMEDWGADWPDLKPGEMAKN